MHGCSASIVSVNHDAAVSEGVRRQHGSHESLSKLQAVESLDIGASN